MFDKIMMCIGVLLLVVDVIQVNIISIMCAAALVILSSIRLLAKVTKENK